MSADVFSRVLDSLPSILGPLIEGVGEAIGMHVTVLIGGPEPKKQGQLNTIRYVGTTCSLRHSTTTYRVFSMHYGVDKQAVPKVWGQADKAGFKLVTNAFTSFLETCYCKYTRFLCDSFTHITLSQHQKSNGRAPWQRIPFKTTYCIPRIHHPIPLKRPYCSAHRRPWSRS